jgi:hypothetical protein
MRKIVQIGLDVEESGGGLRGAIVALGDDGSLWELYQARWHRLPDIPQEAPHED